MRYSKHGFLSLLALFAQAAWSSPFQQTINPAALASLGQGTRWEIGSLFGHINVDFRRAASVGPATADNYSAKRAYPVLPFFAFSHAYSEKLTLGFALDTASYLNQQWNDHTYDVSFGGEALDFAKGGALIARRVGPAAAWRFDKNWSMGARLFWQRMDAMEDSDFSKLAGHGETYGIQVGTRYVGRGYLLGAAFTTRTNTDVRGSQTDVHPLAAASGALIAGDARTDILLPARLHGSIALALRTDLWAELELEWFDWSYVDERTIYQANGTVINQGKNRRHYHDVINTRLGVKWQTTPRFAVYGAIGYEPTQVPDRDVSPAQTFLDRTRVTIGTSWKMERDSVVEVMYQYAHGHSRTVTASDQDTFAGSDTRVFEGTYSSRAHALRISISGTF